jgi:phosphopantothenoylcysteine decarboxylase/phosphopantothenate--cysteine ligase
MSLTNREILIGVTGGIAAYKTAMLVSKLVQAGAKVTVAMTSAAAKFVGPPTFAALTGRDVAIEVFDDPDYPLGAHITLAQQAELFCIAPATANFLAKCAHGLADDLLSTIYLATAAPVLMAPAMNAEMWAKPATQRIVQQLAADGVSFIDPGAGWLSCRQEGKGRMAEPEEILEAIKGRLAGAQ